MKLTRHVFIVLAVALLAFTAGRLDLVNRAASTALAQDSSSQSDDNQPPQMEEMDEQMQAWMAAATPGEHHEMLDGMTGTWDAAVKIWMEPGTEVVEFPGTVTRKWVLDDRFIQEEVNAEGPWGPFKGIGYIGYNNVDGRYEMAWMENMSTAIYMEGATYNADTKVMTSRGAHRDPYTGRLITTWSELDMSDPDRHVYTGYAVEETGKEYKSMEGVFERK